jgi:chemotaxis family two-component system response regulator Rcp1
MSDRPGLHILIVDDSQADSKLMQLWLRDSQSIGSVHHISVGQDALRYIRGEGEFADRVRPDLVLLDSNLADTHGLDVLEELKQDATTRDIGFLVLSGTFNETDAHRARELNAIEYRIKPFDVDDFENFVRRIDEYYRDLR